MLNRNWTVSVIFGTLLALTATGERTGHIFKQQPQQVKAPQFSDSPPDPPTGATRPHFRIDFNLAKPQEMRLLPGVGERLADELIRFRNTHFPVQNVDQLTQVPGVGPAKLSEIAGFLEFYSALGPSPGHAVPNFTTAGPEVSRQQSSDLPPAATQEFVDPLP